MSRRVLIESFERITRERKTSRLFCPNTAITSSVLKRVLQLTLRSPTSFNLQPYKMVVVQSKDGKDLVVNAMIGGNKGACSQASAVVVFLAMGDPTEHAGKLLALEHAAGTDRVYLSSLPSKLSFVLGPGKIATGIKKLTSHLLSPLQPMPVIDWNNQSWSEKNCGIAAQQLMLSATAYGMLSAPMEGFDARRLAHSLRVPLERFSIPLVVCLGLAPGTSAQEMSESAASADSFASEESTFKLTPRFPLREICFAEEFGVPLCL